MKSIEATLKLVSLIAMKLKAGGPKDNLDIIELYSLLSPEEKQKTHDLAIRIKRDKKLVNLIKKNQLETSEDDKRYLRNLANEQRNIRGVLTKAEDAGLCEIVERSNAAIEDILKVFQDKKYNSRIAVFHFAGHADEYRLLMESFTGQHAPAYRQGLVDFFSRQKNLRLIFLNACSTQQHALELIKAGIPAVIGTSQSIADHVAAQLAVCFYNAIANGLSIETAWKDAEDFFNMQTPPSDYRQLYRRYQKHPDRFPWQIHFKPGADKVKTWNLPEAVDDPLFNLPPIPIAHPLPEKPFLFLNHYERKHAELFFGRSYDIRELYYRVTRPDSSPVILLYGQSGVGKSSLLEAGLLPRLENSHTLVYTRRTQEKGLSRTLRDALIDTLSSISPGNPVKTSTIEEAWRYIESQTRKPLVVIVDQVEEVYTRLNPQLPDELEKFLDELKSLFAALPLYPKGKLILGYRKEYHPEIHKKFQDREIDCSSLFIRPLARKDIIDVVTRITRSSRLKDKYNIQVEPPLPRMMADHLLEDIDSPVAPVLQIILTKMWDITPNDDPSPIRYFNTPRYLELKKEGLLMSDFFNLQMEKLCHWNKDVVQSGLALDVLKFHTTQWGTACTRSLENTRDTYSNNLPIIQDLISQLKLLYLLTDTHQNKDETSLAHDTLAPVVIDAYNRSDKPGQRAARVLAAKIEDFKKEKYAVYLDEADLLTVELGQNGMRALTCLEEELLEESRKRKKRREQQLKRFKTFRTVSIAAVVIIAVIALWQWIKASYNARLLQADLFASQAQLTVEKDPTVSLRIAEKAYNINKNAITTPAIHNIFRENSFYKIIARLPHPAKDAGFSSDSRYIIASFDNGPDRRWNLKGEEIKSSNRKANTIVRSHPALEKRYKLMSMDSGVVHALDEKENILAELSGHEGRLCSHAFSPDKKYILTGSSDKTARLWDSRGKLLQVFKGHENAVTSAAFSPNGRYILTGTKDNTLRLWELKYKELNRFDGEDGDIIAAAFSHEGNKILFASTDGIIRMADLNGTRRQVIKDLKFNLIAVSVSPDRKTIIAGSADGVLCLLDITGKQLWSRDNCHRAGISSLDFSKDGRFILSGSYDKTAGLWDLKGNTITVFKGLKHRIMSVAFSPDGKYVLTGSYDKTARLWDRDGKELNKFPEHTDWVTAVAFCPDGKSIITGSGKKIVQWNLDGKALQEWKGHEGIVQTVVFSPDGRYILTGSTDKTAILWDLEGNRLQEFKGHDGFVYSVAFSPDGWNVLTGSSDGTARLWKIYRLEDFLENGVCERFE